MVRGSLRSSVRVLAIALEALAGTLPSPDQLQLIESRSRASSGISTGVFLF